MTCRSNIPAIHRLLLILSAFILSAVIGCAGGTEVGNPRPSNGFETDGDLLEYFIEQYSQSVTATGNARFDDGAVLSPPTSSGGEMSGDKAFSETNRQEEGVDEADKVKTDGRYLYAAGGDHVRIVDADMPAEMSLAGRIEVDGRVNDLYLYDHLLVVLYTPENGDGYPWPGRSAIGDGIEPALISMPYWIPVNAKVGILLVDVQVPEQPEVLRKIENDGNLVSSRRIDGRLYVVSQFMPEIPTLQIWHDGTEEGRNSAIESNRQALAALTLDEFVPSVTVYNQANSTKKSDRLIPTTDFVRPDPASGGGIVSVMTVNLDDPQSDYESIGFIADAQTVYASTESLYLVDTDYPDVVTFAPDPAANEFVTRIYLLDLNAQEVSLKATGAVEGRVINQFSLGEHENVLRIATTTGLSWDQTLENHVFCLEPDGDQLNIIGQIDDIAPGEDLYAARFVGDKGFLVTYVLIDPLFTLDLSDPTDPKVVGELKVPGYSDYIHPLGDDYLLTIGKDTIVDNGTAYYQGVQLSIFDVSDFAEPKLLHSERIGDRGTASEALFDHKAFTYWPEQALLVIPINLYKHVSPPEAPWAFGTNTFNGIFVYEATAQNGFTYLGRIPLTPNMERWMRGQFIADSIFAIDADEVKNAPTAAIDSGVNVLGSPR